MNNIDRKKPINQQGGADDSGSKIDTYSLGVGVAVASVLCCSLMLSVIAAGGGGGYYLYKNKKVMP